MGVHLAPRGALVLGRVVRAGVVGMSFRGLCGKGGTGVGLLSGSVATRARGTCATYIGLVLLAGESTRVLSVKG